MGSRRRTIVYVDGFNLYYGSLKRTPYKWLDLPGLCDLLLKDNEVVRVKYFTAIVDDPEGSARQQTYLRALESTDRVSIYLGHFLSHPKSRRRVRPCAECGERYAEVVITEEKGSDVNLASHLVYDACTSDFEVAAVVSNDSDLVTPIKIAREKCGKVVGVVNPHASPARTLLSVASFYKKLRPGVLGASQLPDEVFVDGRRYVKPDTW